MPDDPQAGALADARKALLLALVEPAPRPLLGTTANPGFFNGSSQAVKAAAKLCTDRGWLEPTGESVGKGKSAKPLYRPTAVGMREALGQIGVPALQELRAQLARLEGTLQAIQAAIAPLRSALAEAPPTAPTPPPPLVPTTAPERPPAPAPSGERLSNVLQQKYEYLCQLVEYEDGLVALPALFDRVREAIPGLTTAEFHAELQRLWDARQVELHILNEVRDAQRLDLAIRRNDAVYYFVLWRDRR